MFSVGLLQRSAAYATHPNSLANNAVVIPVPLPKSSTTELEETASLPTISLAVRIVSSHNLSGLGPIILDKTISCEKLFAFGNCMVISFSIKNVLANQKNKLNEARNKKRSSTCAVPIDGCIKNLMKWRRAAKQKAISRRYFQFASVISTHEMDRKRSIQLRVLYRTMTKKTSPFRIS